MFYMFTCSWLRQRMGDCLIDLNMEDLKLLEEEMDKAAKIVRERKVKLLSAFFLSHLN